MINIHTDLTKLLIQMCKIKVKPQTKPTNVPFLATTKYVIIHVAIIGRKSYI